MTAFSFCLRHQRLEFALHRYLRSRYAAGENYTFMKCDYRVVVSHLTQGLILKIRTARDIGQKDNFFLKKRAPKISPPLFQSLSPVFCIKIKVCIQKGAVSDCQTQKRSRLQPVTSTHTTLSKGLPTRQLIGQLLQNIFELNLPFFRKS